MKNAFSAASESLYGDAGQANTQTERDAFTQSIVSMAKEEFASNDCNTVPSLRAHVVDSDYTHWTARAANKKKVELIPPWQQSDPNVRPFVVLQSWTGVVLERSGKELLVQLTDETNRLAPLSQTTLKMGEIDDEDLFLAQPGAIFYWRIGYDDRASGRQRSSVIRFRRLPSWSGQDYVEAKKVSEELLAFFKGA